MFKLQYIGQRIVSYLFLFLVFEPKTLLSAQEQSEIFIQLRNQPEITSVEAIGNEIFPEKYCLKINQAIDWNDITKGTFDERIILGFRGFDRPTLIVTEGYFADYALSPYYDEELGKMFDANVIVCEYRYFGESVPNISSWEYLTVDNSLCDLHHVREIFGRIFHDKWLSAGISKGGQTTMFYRTMFPDDVDISVSYVAPLNRGVEDGRHEPFISKKVGTADERTAILKAQEELLVRKTRLLPMFKSFSKSHNYNYQDSISFIYDYCVFEFPFALWQWGTPVSTIPSKDASDEEWFTYFIKISDPDYFSCPSKFTPFFIQAARELGYYGYSRKGLKKYCDVKRTHKYLQHLMLPSGTDRIKFDKDLYRRTVKYLKKNDPHHIFIYGENDPWSASGVSGWLDCSHKENMRVYVQPHGSHTARIYNMPDSIKEKIVSRLTKWLEE